MVDIKTGVADMDNARGASDYFSKLAAVIQVEARNISSFRSVSGFQLHPVNIWLGAESILCKCDTSAEQNAVVRVSRKVRCNSERMSSVPKLQILFFILYLLAEIAIAACDLAEVIGMAIGLHLLFPGVSILTGVCITVFDSFILLFLICS